MLFRGSSALAPNPNHDVRLDVLPAEDDGDAGEDADASSIFVLYTLYTPRFPLYSSGTGHDESELEVSVARARSYAARPPSHGGGASGAGLDGAEPMVRVEMRRAGARRLVRASGALFFKLMKIHVLCDTECAGYECAGVKFSDACASPCPCRRFGVSIYDPCSRRSFLEFWRNGGDGRARYPYPP